MIVSIVLLWMAMQMQAPLWVYVCVIGEMVLLTLDAILKIVSRIQKRKLEEASDKLRDQLHRLGCSEDEINKFFERIEERAKQ